MAVSLDDKYTCTTGRAYLTGIEALVRLPILQSQRDRAKGLKTAGFISGYRGSPIGGYDNALWRADSFLKQYDIHFQPGVNEELAATALMGSQQVNLFPEAKYDGVFGLWYGKGPGLDRAMDAIKHANNTGASQFGGVLAVVGDDHMAKSSTLAYQSEPMFVGASMPVLNPAGVQDVLDFGLIGWAMSRFSGCWVGMKVTAENMDAAIAADMNPERLQLVEPDDFTMPASGVHSRWPDPFLEQEERLQQHKIRAALAFARANRIDRVMLDCSQPRFGIVATGKAYFEVLHALADLGIDEAKREAIGLQVYKVAMSWPLEPQSIGEFAAGLEEILVVEEKRPLVEDQLKSLLYALADDQRPRVVGKQDESGVALLSTIAELSAGDVGTALASRLAKLVEPVSLALPSSVSRSKTSSVEPGANLPQRKPWFCAGCPHNTSTKVPEGSRALAGIGCHFMVTWMDRDTETFTQMGGEGASWIGQAPFTNTRHVFQNIGDGTYFHSGILAIRAAIASGANITYKILYNDAVAMTGGQHVDGSLTVEQMVYQLKGEGVKRIAVVSDLPEKYASDFPKFAGLSVDHRDSFTAIQKALRELDGTSVIIYEQTCATEKRRRRKRGLLEDPDKRVFINSGVCEGCGDCGVQSNCLAVAPKETELGRKRVIDQNACNKDFTCLKGFCPSFVTVRGASLHKPLAVSADQSFPDLPAPPVNSAALDEPYNILLTGVGGMGVLTIGSIIGMAAHIEGKGVAVLTQTGLAQKFGAVSSHVRIANTQDDLHGVRVPAGKGQLMLGADMVVSSAQASLNCLDSSTAVAIVNNHGSPTADFTQDPDAPFPEQAMARVIGAATRDAHFFDASILGTALLGDAMTSNLILLGFAWQKGLLPLAQDALEQAITLNGVAVAANLQAFLWGRRLAEQPAKVKDLAGLGEITAAKQSAETETLEDIVAHRCTQLGKYQSRAYARRYRALVDKVKVVEEKLGATELALTINVARNYHKLLAYKDEYEVARLYTDGEFAESLKQQFDGDYKLTFHLAPPLLSKRDPDTGHLLKREFGSWMLPAFRVLAKFKFLRGTALDVFGRSEERRQERSLIADYEGQIEQLLSLLAVSSPSSEKFNIAVEIAGLPYFMRGFGHVKEANIATAQRRGEALMKQLHGESVGMEQVQVVNIQEPELLDS
ncbi:MAG: indolepyruvate ferredoxin oxidoreductase family protein [Porticoccaceae bacterium]|nr:indolepyruvate ferredoxin oxidoreductase family protein [Porticoccaceae bacterium]